MRLSGLHDPLRQYGQTGCGRSADCREFPIVPAFSTSDFTAVFEHFGVRPETDRSSCPWSPVFPVDFEGRRAVVKRTAIKSGEAISRWCHALVEQGVRV